MNNDVLDDVVTEFTKSPTLSKFKRMPSNFHYLYNVLSSSTGTSLATKTWLT